ncbi:Hypothetical predicted protein [Cloeon dipterum]|uniref:Uncharacterized protein n=1 Tax=Cloeon dipterum TaxID=197152 RepID=A0A8S1D887_9INSE|nr:Hypothetical predicted protein [Cloeon dipterum]
MQRGLVHARARLESGCVVGPYTRFEDLGFCTAATDAVGAFVNSEARIRAGCHPAGRALSGEQGAIRRAGRYLTIRPPSGNRARHPACRGTCHPTSGCTIRRAGAFPGRSACCPQQPGAIQLQGRYLASGRPACRALSNDPGRHLAARAPIHRGGAHFIGDQACVWQAPSAGRHISGESSSACRHISDPGRCRQWGRHRRAGHIASGAYPACRGAIWRSGAIWQWGAIRPGDRRPPIWQWGGHVASGGQALYHSDQAALWQ